MKKEVVPRDEVEESDLSVVEKETGRTETLSSTNSNFRDTCLPASVVLHDCRAEDIPEILYSVWPSVFPRHYRKTQTSFSFVGISLARDLHVIALRRLTSPGQLSLLYSPGTVLPPGEGLSTGVTGCREGPVHLS